MSSVRVLIADDHVAFRSFMAALARAALGDTAIVSLARDGREAIEQIASAPPDIVVTDLHMPRASGIEVASAARRANAGALIAVVSGAATCEEQREALAAGASTCIRKPFDVDDFMAILRGALRREAAGQAAATCRGRERSRPRPRR